MSTTEFEKIVQVITDRIMAQLKEHSELPVITLGDELDSYPADAVAELSASYQLTPNSKQDSDAILLCLSQISVQQMIAIANLIGIDEKTRQAVDFLLAGKPVWIWNATPKLQDLRQKTHHAVWGEVERALSKMKAAGCCFKEDIPVVASLRENRGTQHQKASVKYLTKATVVARHQNGETLVKSEERLTPLARDWVNSLRLN